MPTDSAPPPRAIRVLVADDDPSIRLALTLSLERRGHVALGVPDTDSARRILADRGFDIALVDAGMPRDGVGLWRACDRGDLDVSGGALLITGDPWALGDLADHPRVVRKPFDYGALVDRMERMAAAGSSPPPERSAEGDDLAPAESAPEPLPAVERVLAGFCHDLNGALAGAVGFAWLLGSEGAERGPVRQLRDALGGMERTVRELRWLVRDTDREAVPTSLADLLDAVATVLARHPRFEQADVDLEGPDDLPAVRVDFGSALRLLIQTADVAAAGSAVDAVRMRVEVESERVRVGFPAVGTGEAGSRTVLEREAEEARLDLDRATGPGGPTWWVALPRLV